MVDGLAMRVANAPQWWKRRTDRVAADPTRDRMASVAAAQTSIKDRISEIESGLTKLNGRVDGMPIVGHHPYRVADQPDPNAQKLASDIRMMYQELTMRIEFLEAEVKHLKP